MVVQDQELWYDPAAAPPAPTEITALLVPLYDEVTLSYPNLSFPLAPEHPHPPGTDLFIGSVLLDAVNVGTWRRTVTRRRVLVETALAPGLSASERAVVSTAAERLAAFLDLELRTGAT
jgi:hypothetical protein